MNVRVKSDKQPGCTCTPEEKESNAHDDNCPWALTQPEQAKPQGWGEPWRLYGYDGTFGEGSTLFGQADDERLADRIVACVNALAGLNPDKLGELLATCQSVKRARRAMNADGGNPMLHLTYEATVSMMEVALAAIGALPAGDAP